MSQPIDARKVYADALACQDACNGQGVAHLLPLAYALARSESHEQGLGTDYVNTHPAVVLILAKLTDLAHGECDGVFSRAYADCKERSNGPE